MRISARMGKGLNQIKGFGLWAASGLILIALVTGLTSARTSASAPEADKRADAILIDGLKAFGPLERPPVYFFHDRHTEAVAKQGKDCLACHPKGEKYLSLKYRRAADVDKTTAMAVYHDDCIACHVDYRKRDIRSGPVTCGECHVAEAEVLIEHNPMGMDAALHHRHAKAADNECRHCHHAYNAETQQLYYAKGEEGSCRYCHKEQTEENRSAFQTAAHRGCIACHRAKRAQKEISGPIDCGGCHDPQRQALISRPEQVPRLKRNQPDKTLVKAHRSEPPAGEPKTIDRMAVVPFDHQQHEKVGGNCRTCHHAALSACVKCHTLEGDPDGDQVKLAQAMHQADSERSCVGCHNRKKARPECAGCHAAMPAQRVWASETACRVCHIPQEAPVQRPSDDESLRALAAAMIYQRRQQEAPPDQNDIPETVTIGHLKDAYEAVRMPHRRIYNRMAEMIRDDNLAAVFHTAPTTLCQGCHHNSPSSLKPPQCGSCHGRTSDALNLTRPGLMAAFHEQCMQCHERMGIEKPAKRECRACHAERANPRHDD
ncbi:MAG: cytochrome C [Desulfatitalea sp.]|nr:hypothetical protein [Desulfatitalea sp.]NNK00025.1 cytochrome C [Desulfatitalea sp.]